MINLPQHITSLSAQLGYIRSAKYDQGWMLDHSMGPNPLWLVEWLTRDMLLNEKMLVLDMGCGKAVTSIFLAREFGCTVFANDLWIPAEENLKRIEEMGLSRKVFPLHAEAHALPYAQKFFDAITCVDAYIYFGTDELYLSYFSKLVKPGGQIGIVVPGWARDFKGHQPFWPARMPDNELVVFHTADWWQDFFERCGLVKVERCEYLDHGKDVWMASARAMYETKRILRDADGTPPTEKQKELDFWKDEVDFLEADKEGMSALIRIILKRLP